MILCCIDSKEVPEDRQKRKGYAAVTCSDECYKSLRKLKKEQRRSYRFGPDDRALLLRLRRAKFTLSDFPDFAKWWGVFRRAKQSGGGTIKQAAGTVRHDLNASA